MNISIRQAASALQAYEQWHETIAENMSVANVPGYKASQFALNAEETGMFEISGSQGGQSATNFIIPKGSSHLDFSPGMIKHTGLATDLALGESGFFELLQPDGTQAYSRDGEFHINEFGEMVNKQGYPVIGESGPVTFEESTGLNFSVAPDGTISENGQETGQKIKVVMPEDLRKFTSIGGGNYALEDPGANMVEVDNPRIQQKHLEQSNVSAIEQMTRMIQVMRSHEANHHIIQQHDQRLGKLINELGQPI